MEDFKSKYVPGLTLGFLVWLAQGKITFWGFMVFTCALFLLFPFLNNKEIRIGRRFFFIIFGISHTQLGISRSVFIWTTRFLGLVSAVTFILLAFLNAILNPNFLIIGFLVAAGIYFFWYYNWLLDATPPIDRRIINCFRKK